MRFSMPSFPSTRSRSRRRRASRGFSLVEMLVVVAIVGLLIGLVGPAAMRQLQSSRVKTTEAQISQVRAALDIYLIDTGTYPSQAQGLQALVTAAPGVAGWNGPYLRDGALPQDAWGNAFGYVVRDGQVLVTSLGADGQEGGSGQDADLSN